MYFKSNQKLCFMRLISLRHHEKNLIHHIAEKRINYIDETGMLKKPAFKNGIKLEKFIFDIFPFSKYIFICLTLFAMFNNFDFNRSLVLFLRKFAIWEVVRRDEFSPLKNGKNDAGDNEITCRKHILEQHARWIENAGIELENFNK